MEQIEKDFIDFMQKSAEISGEDNGLVSLFAYIYMQPEDISIEEIAKETGYSLPTVSNKIKLLENIGLIIKFRKPKSKKIYVKAIRDLLGMIEEDYINRKLAVLEFARESIPQIIEKYTSKAIKKEKIKIEILKGYLKQVEKTQLLIENIKDELKCLRAPN